MLGRCRGDELCMVGVRQSHTHGPIHYLSLVLYGRGIPPIPFTPIPHLHPPSNLMAHTPLILLHSYTPHHHISLHIFSPNLTLRSHTPLHCLPILRRRPPPSSSTPFPSSHALLCHAPPPPITANDGDGANENQFEIRPPSPIIAGDSDGADENCIKYVGGDGEER